jgi:hypothetical protein
MISTQRKQADYLQRSEHRQNLLSFHPQWLDELNHTCQFCGKKHVGQTRKSKYEPYAFHHSDSESYGNEDPGTNYLLVCKRCHWLVHLLGGELMLRNGNVQRQNRRAKKLGRKGFPNGLQRGFNWVCIFPGSLGEVIIISVVAIVLAAFLALIAF